VNDLIRAAIRLDLDAVVGMVSAWIADHGLIVAWELLIRPAWTDLSHPHDGADAFMAERLFSQSVSHVLACARRRDRLPIKVVAACAEQEDCVLPLDVLAVAFAEAGIGVCVLGAQVPREALADAAGQLGPAVVVIWSQNCGTAEPSQVAALLTAYPACVVIPAGPGWSPAALPALAAPLTSVAATLTVAQALLQRKASAERPVRTEVHPGRTAPDPRLPG
jgi:hypothetical protein